MARAPRAIVTQPPAEMPAEAPPKTVRPVRLTNVYRLIDDYGDRWLWGAGAVVNNPFVIEMLRKHGAPIEEIL